MSSRSCRASKKLPSIVLPVPTEKIGPRKVGRSASFSSEHYCMMIKLAILTQHAKSSISLDVMTRLFVGHLGKNGTRPVATSLLLLQLKYSRCAGIDI